LRLVGRLRAHGFDARLIETTACLMAYNLATKA
jgi:hypothetical protein